MPNVSNEEAAIEAAYSDQLKLLFKTLCIALGDEHNDNTAVSRFTTGSISQDMPNNSPSEL